MKIQISKLNSHPFNRKVYGFDDNINELVDRIKESNWVKPILINTNNMIISGHRSGKTGVLDHPLPIFVDHNIFLTINKVRWSLCSGEDWSKRAFFPPYGAHNRR